jgi:hypothetical protein
MVRLTRDIRIALVIVATVFSSLPPLAAQNAKSSRQNQSTLQIRVNVSQTVSSRNVKKAETASPVAFNFSGSNQTTVVQEELPYHPPAHTLPKGLEKKPAVLRTITYVPD